MYHHIFGINLLIQLHPDQPPSYSAHFALAISFLLLFCFGHMHQFLSVCYALRDHAAYVGNYLSNVTVRSITASMNASIFCRKSTSGEEMSLLTSIKYRYLKPVW